MYSDERIRPWFEAVAGELGELRLFDIHTHVGASDPDGYSGTTEALLEALEAAGGASAAVFPQQEPDGYPRANDRVIDDAERSGGRLVAFCRVDPHAGGAGEAERCLARGARGIKLHPRAERFRLAEPSVETIIALAGERRLPVMIHAGRGIPALGRDALALAERHPGARLILAHAGISDLAWLWRYAPEHPNLFFDTSWWSPDDLLALFSLVPPGQVLFASDAPYGTPLSSVAAHLRLALAAGLSPEQVRVIAGEQSRRLVAGEEPLDLGPALGRGELAHDLLMARAYVFLIAGLSRMFAGGDGEEQLALARLACDVGDEAPQAPACRSILELLADGHEPLPDELAQPFTPGVHRVLVALSIARSPGVALPDLGTPPPSGG